MHIPSTGITTPLSSGANNPHPHPFSWLLNIWVKFEYNLFTSQACFCAQVQEENTEIQDWNNNVSHTTALVHMDAQAVNMHYHPLLVQGLTILSRN